MYIYIYIYIYICVCVHEDANQDNIVQVIEFFIYGYFQVTFEDVSVRRFHYSGQLSSVKNIIINTIFDVEFHVKYLICLVKRREHRNCKVIRQVLRRYVQL